MRSYHIFIDLVAKNMDLSLDVSTRNRPVFERLSMNKSPFIFKKHQRQYEFRTFYKTFTFHRLTGTTANVILEYLQRNTPEGIALNISKHKVEELPEFLQQKLTEERSHERT
ncbi:28S ribosomal protein S10, mitochondrial [Cichlidogyrus casuarinus]|uniref:Small ribosomal subunit protein uS10m n=1 Tax=Cichlidogyrus casuarinus TaxID=1844966 RepID=A0ABD2Q4E0_9PLAT